MSIRIELHFRKTPNIELLNKGVDLPSIRLMAWVKFKVSNTWSWYYEAIVDTGALVSLVPPKIWHKADHKVETDYTVCGVIPKKECALPVDVGRLVMIMFDEQTESKPIPIIAYLSQTDEVPLILGFNSILEDAEFCVNYPKRKAWIQI